MTRTQLEDAHDLSVAVQRWLVGTPAVDERDDHAQWSAAQWRAAAMATEVLGVAAVLHDVLARRRTLGELPPGFRRTLARCHARCQARAGLLESEARQVLALSATMDVPLVLFGDTALSLRPCQDQIARSGADAHVLVRPAQESRFTAALARAGWVGIVRRVTPSVTVSVERDVQRTGWEGATAEPLSLTLHTSADFRAENMRFDLTGQYWHEAQSAVVAGAPTLVPSPLRLMQRLLLRASKQLLTHELPLASLWNLRVASARLSPADWSALADEALEQGEARLFWTPLRLAERALAPFSPPDVLGRLERQVPQTLRTWAEGSTLADWSARRFHPEWPVDASRWCRSSWERTMAARRRILPLPGELGSRSVVRGYLNHVWSLVHRPARGASRARRPAA